MTSLGPLGAPLRARVRIVSPVVVFAVTVAGGRAVAAAGPDGLMATHAEIIEKYRDDDRERAIREVAGWNAEFLERLTAEAAKTKALSPGSTAVPLWPPRIGLPAAVMLHTEAGLYLNWQGDGVGASRHWLMANTLAEMNPSTAEQQTFLRSWYRAFGLFFLGSYDADGSIRILKRGHERFPDDVLLSQALGQAHEARGAYHDGKIRTRTGIANVVTTDLSAAESVYRDLLARDPSLGEARLRLGSVLEMSGRPGLALTEFRQAATVATAGHLRYLSHLFAGNLLRHASRLVEAEAELRLALVAWPSGQAAALSLAETLHAMGKRTASAAVLLSALAPDAVTPGPDPFRSYYFGDRAEHKRQLEAVAQMARRRPQAQAGTIRN
jgi:tetratricopeptide (TPR) repeat protein